ncbi:MAG TPA: L-aspartate oxidase [Gammaproteobacteria bacterium]|nr:L-aspartate oxidase [Gammaproteobacteria bacterium]
MANKHFDVLIIGSGLAGLGLALRLADTASVAVVSKGQFHEGSSYYAQGGVAAVLGNNDSIQSHKQDTLDAGAGLCDPVCVDYVIKHGPENIQWLIDQGVGFSLDIDGKHYHLTREGGHSHRRVIHAADATGKAIETTLEQKTRDHPNIHLFEYAIAIDLITSFKLGRSKNHCLGVYIQNQQNGKIMSVSAANTVLATGGASKVYLYTSNPDTSTGDGIAMAWRAGCRVANMEFVQFHPTCLYHPEAKSFLISEALRGEGAHLLLPDGTRFMEHHDKRAEMAPRDIVARAIDYEMKKGGLNSVYLDISHRNHDFIIEHFPTIYARCLKFGMDITTSPIPVVPAAHYTCGGVITDLNGRTDVEDLYAIGECTCTGLHGANRLASNSLLECLVFSQSASHSILESLEQPPAPIPELPQWDESQVTDPDEQVVVSHNWDELRRFMWDYVGIVRTNKRLQRAQNRIELLKDEIEEFYSCFKVDNNLLELRNLVVIAELTIRSAQSRKESRGLHFTRDYPESNHELDQVNTILTPVNFKGASINS